MDKRINQPVLCDSSSSAKCAAIILDAIDARRRHQQLRICSGSPDPDGDALTYALSVHPAGMTINPRSGLILWSPTTTQIGNNNVVVQVADGKSAKCHPGIRHSSHQVATNAPPRFTSLPVVVASVEELYRYAVTASDRRRTVDSNMALFRAPTE